MKVDIKFSKLIVGLAIFNILLYTAISVYVSLKGYSLDSQLTVCFYSFWGIEVLSLAGIRKSENRYSGSFDDNIEEHVKKIIEEIKGDD